MRCAKMLRSRLGRYARRAESLPVDFQVVVAVKEIIGDGFAAL